MLPSESDSRTMFWRRTSCRAVHPAVGCSVTLKCTSRRRSWLSTTSTNRTRKVAVGTVKKSNAIRSLAWFIRNARHACDGGRRGRSMYCETGACETVRLSFNSSLLGSLADQTVEALHRCRDESLEHTDLASRVSRYFLSLTTPGISENIHPLKARRISRGVKSFGL